MKLIRPLLLLLLAPIFFACETFEEDETLLLPVNMTATIVRGEDTQKIIADFHYVPESARLDHITWSNHQTHYFEYDELERMRVVRQVKVDSKMREELWFHYDGELVERITLVSRHLDYIFLEPTDSIFTGSVVFLYEGDKIVEEKKYEANRDGKEELVWQVEYDYDLQGNIISCRAFDPRTNEEQELNMTYDSNKHPFAGMEYYFKGESYVNNPLSKTGGEHGLDYTYELRLNEKGYPEIVYEKVGSAHTRIIRYSYMTL